MSLDYRIIVEPTGSVKFPDFRVPWTLFYRFLVPPLPTGDWDPNASTFYVWGDTDFDDYGLNRAHPISDYLYNQIVPQIMIGSCYGGGGNGPCYKPVGKVYRSWVVQSQYFWAKTTDDAFGLVGDVVAVNPGELVFTWITYDPGAGSIRATIGTRESGFSTLVSHQPFPNDPSLFTSWKDFFQKAQAKSGFTGFNGNPVLNVETHGVPADVVCSITPFNISGASVPGFPWVQGNWNVRQTGGLSCTDPAKLDFADVDTGYVYRLTNEFLGDGKSLDIIPGNPNLLKMADTADVESQHWMLAPNKEGFYRLTNVSLGSGKSLDVYNDQGNKPLMANTGTQTGEQWKVEPLSNGYYRLTNNFLHESRSLDTYSDDGNAPFMGETGNKTGQFWKLTPIAPIG